ncbi:unnamed protein product [Cyclocybe aegerita]|uniref:Uncharacterized protein n=1 Tax=Cyclocybe aegerita TaxID=1973307 RepID=A0A8S0XRJ4_CYCAE|nr:unnamed protein product [Cyclocybe aegerita]
MKNPETFTGFTPKFQFTFEMKFSTAVLLALAAVVVASPTPEVPASFILTDAEFDHWLATTDAEITYVGEPYNPLTERDILATRVTYCSQRVFNVCGGACTVYNGGATCLNAPNTNCLAATNNVGFCDRAGCGGSCNQLSTCGTRLDGGFCYTPATRSILVGNF